MSTIHTAIFSREAFYKSTLYTYVYNLSVFVYRIKIFIHNHNWQYSPFNSMVIQEEIYPSIWPMYMFRECNMRSDQLKCRHRFDVIPASMKSF